MVTSNTAKLIGILNITPDSFSDGGKGNYIERAEQMLAAGAYAIDIGAESTRPGAFVISPDEEWQRLEPILTSLTCAISIDTRNPETAERALRYDCVKYLNDVSGFSNPQMIQLAASSGVHIISMHSLSVPADKNITLTSPPVETLKTWINEKYLLFTQSGISADKITFDPGIGFGKTPEQSQELIARAAELADTCHKLGTKILYGHSRKSFLGGDIPKRDLETAKISAYLQNARVDYIRVHNIEINKAALKQQENDN